MGFSRFVLSDCAPAYGSEVRLFEPVLFTGLKAGASTLFLCRL
jgi:hypothetical protein